jgi:hypothetical protein
MASIELSEKSLKLIEMRRGARPATQYLNMVMENLYDKMSSSGLIINGMNLFDIIESKMAQSAPTPVAATAPVSASKVPEILKALKSSCPGKIPYNMFYQECIEHGVTRAEIEEVTQKNRGLFQIQLYNDDEYAKLLLVIIYNYLKELYSTTLSTSQFYGKCLEEGLNVDDIRYAESVWQITIPDLATLKELSTKTDSMGIENRLLKLFYGMKTEYPATIPIAVLQTKCAQFGMSKEDIGNLEKIYTRHLLSKHNDMVSGTKKVENNAGPSIKDINARVKAVLDDAMSTYGDNVPELAFIDKCKAAGFTLEEQMYARKIFEDYLVSQVSYKEIKYMNKKAYIILTSLRKTYPSKIPYNIFFNKCKAIGMKTEEIADAIKQSGNMISTEKSDEQHYLQVLDDIITGQKKAST